jgi:hypothetical protein
MAIAHLLEVGSWWCDALMATGTEALRKSAALVAEPVSGPLWKNRFQKNAMLDAVGAFTPRESPELLDSAQADAGEPTQHPARQ